MKKKAFIKHVNQNPKLKKWLIENQNWVQSNPQVVKQLIDHWSTMQSVQPSPYSNLYNLPKHGGSKKRIKLPKVNLNTISQATQQLTKTMGMIENMKNIIGIFGPK